MSKLTEATTKKSTRRKAKVSVFVEYEGNQYNVEDIVKMVSEKTSEKDVSVYIKPDERVAYYTVNGEGCDEFKVEF